MVSSWPAILDALKSQAPFESLEALVARVKQYRPGSSYDALGAACRRYNREWTPMDLVQSNDPVTYWDEHDDTVPGAEPMDPQEFVTDYQPRMTLAPGDIHCPIWDRDLVFAVVEFARMIGCDHLAITGDLLDVYRASRFSKAADRLYGTPTLLVDELRALTGFYETCSSYFDRVDWLLGNHEARAAEKFVNENDWLYQHPALDPRSIFMVPKRWNLHSEGTRLRFGNVCYAHGHKLKGSGAQHTSANVLKWNPYQHTVYGHTHRAAQSNHTVYDAEGQPVIYTATSAGHLSQLKYHREYTAQPNWCHAFTITEHHPERPQVHLVKIQGRRWLWMGKEYGVGC